MKKDPLNEQMRELSWRPTLTAAQQSQLDAWLAAHPEARADWEAEAGLNEALGRLPDVPVASNFTARVLQEVEREMLAEERRNRAGRGFWGGWTRWLPRAATVAAVLGLGLLSYNQVQVNKRARLAQSLAAVSTVGTIPSPEILRDYDAIEALSQASATPAADEELLKLMQ